MDEIVGQDIFFSWENVLIGYENEVGLVQLDIVILDMFELVMVVVLVKLYIDVFYVMWDEFVVFVLLGMVFCVFVGVVVEMIECGLVRM